MFNFNLVNKAFGDERITPTQFKMLYLIVNNCSMNNTTTIKMFNGFMADKMGLSVRMMQYNVKQLEDCGYIEVKRPIGRNAAKKPNEITLLGVEDDTTCDKNVTPYNSIEETVKESTQINDAIDCTPYKNKKEYKNNISMYRDHEADVTNEQVKLSKDELNQRNEYISDVYGKLDNRLKYLYGLKTATQYEDVCTKIAEIFSDAQEHMDWFTEPQWDKMTRYSDRFVKLTEAKDKYFNGKNTKIYVDESSSIEEEMASAHESSADEAELISTVANDSVGYVDALVTSTDEETIPEADIISADDNSTSTELYPWDVDDVTSTEDELTDEADLTSVDSSKGDLNLTDRFTLSQLEDKNPPQVPLVPPLKEFQNNVKQAIRKGVYDWSLTLDYVPDDIIADEYNPIVRKALEAQPDLNTHMGYIRISDFNPYAKELMLNRIKNKDIPAIVRQNQYNKRHKAFHNELMNNNN